MILDSLTSTLILPDSNISQAVSSNETIEQDQSRADQAGSSLNEHATSSSHAWGPSQSFSLDGESDEASGDAYLRGWGSLDIEALDLESSFPTSRAGGEPKTHWVISEHVGKRALIEQLVELVEKRDVPAWRLTSMPGGTVYMPTVIGHFCEPRLALLSDLDDKTFPPQGRYSERFHLFVAACQEVRRAGHTEFGSRLPDPVSRRIRYEAENALIACIRAKTQTRAYRDRLRHRLDTTRAHEESGRQFLDEAFHLCGRLLVGRCDFSYVKGSASSLSIEQLRADLLRFWRVRRQEGEKEARLKSRKDPFIGYIRGVEFADQTGYHVHCLFFLNGYTAKSAYFHGNKLGELWKRVTQGRGRFFNCAADPSLYKTYYYLGTVNRHEEEKRALIFNKGIKYLAKNDEYSTIMVVDVRRLQTSQLEEKSASGRPCLPRDERK